jgi:TolB protein
MRFAKLTTSGKVWRAAISPDGRYVAYVQSDRSGQGLWLKQTSSSRSIQIVESALMQFQGLSFAPDGGSIYYAVYEKGRVNSNLYQIPALGGAPRKIIEDVDSTVAFAPDGNHFAFVRNEANMKESSLVIADTATGSERRLLTHSGFASLSNEGPAWSPDGKLIVVPERIGDPSRGKWKLLAVDANTGERQEFDSREWDAIGQTAWLSDGHGLIFAGRENPSSVLVYKLWQISYPTAETRMITNDLNSYTGVGITSGSSPLLTIQSDRVTNFSVISKNAFDKPVQITTGSGDKPSEVMGMAWTPNNRIVYGSSASGDIELWIMDADGSNQKQLTADQYINFKPSVTPDGRSIVFVSRKGGAPHIWKMDIDGTNRVQLTDGNAETYPSVSPDGAYIIYSSLNAGVATMWRIPVNGGTPEQLMSEPAYYQIYSPDGRYIAALLRPENEDKWTLAILPKDGGETVKKFDIPRTTFYDGGLHWSPDSQAVQYVNYREGAGNIWSQPLNGDPPRQLTNFASGQIFRFGWSLDGRQLAIDHGLIINDAVLITNFA